MARRNLATKDASSYAASELEYVIKKRKPLATDDQPPTPTSTPEEAMRAERVYNTSSSRNVTRVLFISQNTELLNPTEQTLDGYVKLSDLFDEVHILILRTGITPRQPVIRAKENVYIYTAAGSYWWLAAWNGWLLAEDQLVFAAGFRPDLIIAHDQYESAWVANRLAKRYHKPTQLHILENSDKPGFVHSILAAYLTPHFYSIRTATKTLAEKLQKRYTEHDVQMLPRFHDYESLIDAPITVNLKEKYQPMVFFMLYTGRLDHDSSLHQVIDAARFVLHNRRVGLVVVGDGPARSEFQKKAKTLGIDEQVIFERTVPDVVSYMKSSNILIVPDTDKASEEVALLGAAAGVPLVLTETPKREDIFEHGDSAFLCRAGDVQMMSNRINELLNNVSLRQQFVEQGQQMIKEKFHQDPNVYRTAYRESIEQALFASESDRPKS